VSQSADPERAKLRAEEKTLRDREGAEAWAEHQAQGQAVDERTARLRALRLARDAEAAAAVVEKPSPARKARKAE
jgi:hypothetical protein